MKMLEFQNFIECIIYFMNKKTGQLILVYEDMVLGVCDFEVFGMKGLWLVFYVFIVFS